MGSRRPGESQGTTKLSGAGGLVEAGGVVAAGGIGTGPAAVGGKALGVVAQALLRIPKGLVGFEQAAETLLVSTAAALIGMEVLARWRNAVLMSSADAVRSTPRTR